MAAFRTILALGLVTQASAAFDCAKYVSTCSGLSGYEAYSNCAATAAANAMTCRSQHLDLAAQSGGAATHCPHAQPTATGTCASETLKAADIVETAQVTSDVSILVEALVKADLVDTLKGTGPFTVFAPTNAAFTAALTALKIDKAALLARSDLADILKYHVLPGKIMAADLSASQTPATVQGLKVMVTKSNTGVTFGSGKVTTADVACANGVIHIIDTVVLPPSLNVVETAQATPDFSVLVEAVVKANLATTLSGTGPFTVFAPTNAAFTAALTALKIDKAALLARSDLADILKYHVVPGKIMAADLQASQAPATVQGLKVLVEKSSTGVTFGGAKVTAADIPCTNGVIHVIDAVVLPPSMNIVQTAQATPDFSVLVEAVVKANLATTLSGTGPFTVFAPTNAAFTAALTALKIDKAALLARSDLADILKYHVVPGKIMAADLQASQEPATVQGKKVLVEKSSTGVTFGGAKVTTADIPCANGVIHIIDAVVLPPSDSKNIVETAQATADFSVLVEAVVKANLATTLSGTGPFTVFAPNNAAFTAALAALKIDKAALLARTDLADILKYHVVPGKIMAADLKASQAPATVQGLKVLVEKSSTGVTFGGAKVTTADIACSNGVIHVIDAVVLPPSMNVVQTAQASPGFSVLVEAVVKANLATTLSGAGPFTVFAPTNAAFTAALTALNITKTELLARTDLADILKYHVLSGKIMAADLKTHQTPATLQGKTVMVHKDASGVTFGGAKVTGADIACSNGVIHQIDKVVLPPAATTTSRPAGISVPSGAPSNIAAVSFFSSVAMMIFA